MGQVFIAVDSESQDIVVVKRQPLSEDSLRELTFCHAARNAPCTHLIRILDHFCCKRAGSLPASSVQPVAAGAPAEHTLDLYCVCEWMDTCLWDLFQGRTGVFHRGEVVQLTYQSDDAMAHLHDLDIIHGDLSFKNILVRRVGEGQYEVKVADFGACTARVGLGRRRPGCSEHVRAPELFLRLPARSVTTAVDVWALGVLLGSLSCASLLFEGFEHIVKARSEV